MMRKITVVLVAIVMLFGVVANTGMMPVEVYAEAEFMEDDFWDVFDSVVALQNSDELPTQEEIDEVRAAVETIPEDFEIAGINRSSLIEIMDWVQARFDEGTIEVTDPAEWEDGELFRVIDGGGEYNGEGYSIEVVDIDVWEDDVYQYRYLKFGDTWSEWSEEKPEFTGVKAGQDKYTVEVRLMAGNGGFLEKPDSSNIPV